MSERTPKSILLIALLAVLVGCGGGGGNDSGDGETPEIPGFPDLPEVPDVPEDQQVSILLSWEKPTEREDGSALPPEEIQGYILVGVSASQIERFSSLRHATVTENSFRNNLQEINHFVLPSDIRDLVDAGSRNVALISSGEQTSAFLPNIPPDTYYFAVSAVDMDFAYSLLSPTTTVVVPDLAP